MPEASLIRGVKSCFADRVRGLDTRIDAVRSRADSLEPWVLCAASNAGAFAALHRFEFDRAREWHEWGIPYLRYVTGALSVMYSHCLAGMAAREQLDMTQADDHFRTRCGWRARRPGKVPSPPASPVPPWAISSTNAANSRRPITCWTSTPNSASRVGESAWDSIRDRPGRKRRLQPPRTTASRSSPASSKKNRPSGRCGATIRAARPPVPPPYPARSTPDNGRAPRCTRP